MTGWLVFAVLAYTAVTFVVARELRARDTARRLRLDRIRRGIAYARMQDDDADRRAARYYHPTNRRNRV